MLVVYVGGAEELQEEMDRLQCEKVKLERQGDYGPKTRKLHLRLLALGEELRKQIERELQ